MSLDSNSALAKSTPKKKILVGLVLLAGISALWIWAPFSAPPTASEKARLEAVAPATTVADISQSAQAPNKGSVAAVPDTAKLSRQQEFAASMREEFAAHIHHPKIQIRVIEKMMAFLQSLYGDDWQAHIEEMLRMAFPELMDILLPRFQNLIVYNDWALAERTYMASMPEEERRQYVWAKRTELFGEDALIIWQGLLRNEQVQDVLSELAAQPELAFEQKLDYYLGQVQQIYQSDAPKMLARRGQEVMDNFLKVDTVQYDLHQMPKAERSAHLRELRKAVGLDEAALQRWDELDQVREQRWQVGKSYLAQRNELESTLQGEALNARLHALQDQLFGEEADVIRNEEASGYYRFQGTQQIGLN